MMIQEGDHVKLKKFGHYWKVENMGKEYAILYYRGARRWVKIKDIKYEKIKGRYRKIGSLSKKMREKLVNLLGGNK